MFSRRCPCNLIYRIFKFFYFFSKRFFDIFLNQSALYEDDEYVINFEFESDADELLDKYGD